MNRKEQYKRILKFGSAAVILLIEVGLYWLLWQQYNRRKILEKRNLAAFRTLRCAFGILFADLRRTQNRLPEKRKYNLFTYTFTVYSEYDRILYIGSD